MFTLLDVLFFRLQLRLRDHHRFRPIRIGPCCSAAGMGCEKVGKRVGML